MIDKPLERFARVCGLVCLALSLTACAARQPAVPDPSREARLVRSVVEDLKAGSSSSADSGPCAGGGRLVALSSARAAARSPARAALSVDADTGWFMEPSLHNVEECAHCQEEGTVRVSSEYGTRRDPKRRSRYRIHHGVDIRAPKGSPVLAFKGGTVIRAGVFGGYGRTVEIRQYDGMVARYAHLHKTLVTEGDDVSAGTQVGEVGRTGRATGAHLHFELLKDGKSQDPMRFLIRAEQVVRCLFLESARE